METPPIGDESTNSESIMLRIQTELLKWNALDTSKAVDATVINLSQQSVIFRVKFANALIAGLKSLGYSASELNFSQLLYPVENDTARIFDFLAAKNASTSSLSKAPQSAVGMETSINDSLQQAEDDDDNVGSSGWDGIATSIERWMNAEKAQPKSRTRKHWQVMLTERRKHSQKQQQDLANEEEERAQQAARVQKWKTLEARYRANAARMGRLRSVIRAREDEIAKLQERSKARERARLLSVADADGNAAKLEQIVQASEERVLALVREWEQHRVPMVNEIKKLTIEKSARMKTETALLEDITLAREELKEIQARLSEVAENDEEDAPPLAKALNAQDAELRATVVARVLDSVRQVKKQQVEIERIVEDVRLVQKDVSQASETMQLVEAETDELLFLEAKQHPRGVEIYEHFVEMIERFDELMHLEHEAHLAEIEARDKIARCHSVAARVSTLKVESVLADLQKIKAENARLTVLIQQRQ